MANAEEMLARALAGDISGSDSNILAINWDTRLISVPGTLKCLGVESDDDVTRIDFVMPQYYDDVDLSDFLIHINYLNANAEGDVYKVGDAMVSDGVITFSWLVGRHALAYKGNVKFNVCLKKLDDNNPTIVVRELNTTIANLPVLEGLETSEAVIQAYADILVQWEEELFGSFNVLSDNVNNTIADKTSDVNIKRIIDLYFEENGLDTVPSGGTTGQVLAKVSDADSDVEWKSLTASDVKARPDTWIPTAEEVKALGENEQAVDSAKLGGKPPEYYCNHLVNRLDNSNFKIATVGYDGLHGTVRYAADRWKISSSETSVSYDATTGVMTISADATSQYRTGLDQGLAYVFTGKTLTMAICDADDNVYCGSGTIRTADGALVDVVVTDSFTLRLRQYKEYLSAAILCVPSKSIGVKWAALYEGEYTVDTLPPYVPKDRNLEEIACAGYYQRYTSNQNWAWYPTGVASDTQTLRVCMPLPYPMRHNPTVTIAKPENMTLFLPVAEGTVYGINSVLGASVYSGTNMLLLYLEANVTLTKGRTLSIRLNTDIELSADI